MKRTLPFLVSILILLPIGLWRAQRIDPTLPESTAVLDDSAAADKTNPTRATDRPIASSTNSASVISPLLSAEIHDPTSARLAMRALQDQEDCWLAKSKRRQRHWETNTRSAWLPPDELAQARAVLPEARRRLLAACQRAGLSDDDSFEQLQPRNWDEMLSLAGPLAAEISRTQRQALEAGNLQARLLEVSDRRGKPDIDGEVRPLLERALTQAIREGQLELLPALARVLSRHDGPQLGPLASWYGIEPDSRFNAQIDQRALWLLVGCDLGLDCGAESVTLDRLCLHQGLCAYPNVEAAVYDGMVRNNARHETELRRQWATSRLRSGHIAGMFDAVPERARSGGG